MTSCSRLMSSCILGENTEKGKVKGPGFDEEEDEENEPEEPEEDDAKVFIG